MPQNRHLANWRKMLTGAKVAAGETVEPETDTGLSPELQAAYERRRGPNWGKDIRLPLSAEARAVMAIRPAQLTPVTAASVGSKEYAAEMEAAKAARRRPPGTLASMAAKAKR